MKLLVELPTLIGNRVTPIRNIYMCKEDICNDCQLRFQCLTNRGEVVVSFEDWIKVRHYLVHSGSDCQSGHRLNI